MKGKGKTLLTLFLITWVVFSGVFFLEYAHRYIGKTYFETAEFRSTMYDFQEGLKKYVLTSFDAEQEKKKITVTNEEIERYRTFYGGLEEQIANIREQYDYRIEEAENSNNQELKKSIEKERDEKITDIKKNFENNQYVAEKIKKIKYAIIDQYAIKYQNEKENFHSNFKYFSYNLKNIKTGETFKSGDNESTIYSEKYGDDKGYFYVVNPITIRPDELEVSRNEYDDNRGFNEYNEFYLFYELPIKTGEAQYEGTISISKSMLNEAWFKGEYENFMKAKIIFNIIWISGIAALILLFTVFKPSKKMFEKPSEIKSLFSKFPLDIKVFILFIIAIINYYIINMFGISLYNSEWFVPMITTILMLWIFISLFTFLFVWTLETINSEEKFIKQVKDSFIYELALGIVDLFLYRSIAIIVVVCLFTLWLFGFGFGLTYMGDGLFIIFISLFGLPFVLIFLNQMGYLNRIMKHTERMAEGRSTSNIEVKGKYPLSRHAANLNKVREGVEKSMLEQAKSERLKTELITNVSHDLRTPLTSIITYTDLLKNDNISEEERKHYIEVIDKKSARLKTLIEDLFEVSKMASGNIELNKQKLDLCQLLQQAVGEHKEAFENSNLELRVSMPDQPVFAYVDGQKWWRVLDNLIVNALKYSLAGTRVYISLTKQGQEVIFTIKNVSSYELTENADELVERFKRADTARNTEGSGLGLAIVQSIVNLHNGKMNIEVDGDLFKVTVITGAE